MAVDYDVSGESAAAEKRIGVTLALDRDRLLLADVRWRCTRGLCQYVDSTGD
jgi:hypothetical protein